MNSEAFEDLLRSHGCWFEGHFVYASGRHGSDYIDIGPLLARPHTLDLLGQLLAEGAMAYMPDIGTVIGPASKGQSLAEPTARHLASLLEHKIRQALNHKVIGTLGRTGFDFSAAEAAKLVGRDTLVVEDTLNTGESVRKLIDVVIESGGTVVGVAAITNRGGVTAEDLGVPHLYTVFNRQLPSFDPGPTPGDFAHSDCPLCRAGVQINISYPRGKAFVDAFGQPPPKSL